MVSRSVIHHEDFNVAIGLAENTVNSIGNQVSPVICGDDGANQWFAHNNLITFKLNASHFRRSLWYRITPNNSLFRKASVYFPRIQSRVSWAASEIACLV